MLQPKVAVSRANRFLLVLCITLLTIVNPASSQLDGNQVKPTPVLKNDHQDVATVLVADINNRAAHGRYLNIKPEIGLLKSTARTFIQDGIKTEYVTKVIGSTIDNGQYVQLLTTTSRVLYNNDNLQTKTVNQNSIDPIEDASFINSPPSSPFLQNIDYIVPSNPHLVFPARKNRNQNEVIKNHNINSNDNENEESEILLSKAEKLVDDPRSPVVVPKPSKVVPEANLPTYTVSHDGPIFQAAAPLAVSSPRAGKVITYEEEVKAESENKILPSVTYFGFADFTTTVGDTVIIFSPSTAKPQIDAKDHVTSIKGEPTLNIKPTSTKQQHITFSSVEPTNPRPNEEPKFTPKIVETALPKLTTTPKYSQINRETTNKQVETTTEEILTTTVNEEEDDEEEEEDSTEDSSTSSVPLTTPETPKKPQIEAVSPDFIEPSQMSVAVTPSFSVPSNEEVLKILASLNRKIPDTGAISSSPVKDDDEPETKVLTGSSIIFFDDITTPKMTSVETTESTDDDEDDNDDETTSLPTTTEKIEEILLVKPLLSKSEPEKKVESSCVTTTFKTLSFKTTFYVPVDEVITTTSVKTNTVVSSEVVPVDCEIKPTVITERPTTSLITTTDPEIDSEEEDDASSTSQSPATKTNDSNKKQDEASTAKSQIGPVFTPETTTMEVVTESSTIEEETTVENDEEEDVEVIYKTLYTTYTYLTTFFQDSTTSVSSRKEIMTNIITSTINANDFASLLNKYEPSKPEVEINPTEVLDVGVGRPTEQFSLPENDFIGVNQLFENEKVEYTPALSDDDIANSKIKTLYTTYTYFTTLFNEGKSEIASRTEVYTNIINPSSSLSNVLQKDLLETKFVLDAESVNNKLNDDSDLKQPKKLKLEGIFEENDLKPDEKAYSTMIRNPGDLQPSGVENSDWDDIKSSVSEGERTFIDSKIDRRNWNYEGEDQISSESNTEEGIPSPTLLLQTRYTTFTYYTTMFDGASSSNILSRLETLTNVVTETLAPTQIQKLDASVPVTYFTTFTYWTTFYKDGTTKTTSREETVSNIVTPTVVDSSVEVQKTLTTSVVTPSSDILLVAPLETVKDTEKPVLEAETSKTMLDSSSQDDSIKATPVINSAADPTTLLTTYTYYTTNYIGDETVIDSRFETETNVVTPTVEVKQPKAIDLSGNKNNKLDHGGKGHGEEKLAKKEKLSTVEATPALQTKQPENNVVSINHGKIIDAEGISTTHFKTQAIGTYIDSLYAEVLETSSSIEIDEIRKSLQPTELDASTRQHKTGLVRLIDGTIVNKNATTLYESKVIGTFIDGRYAQVIESTSSIILAKAVQPTSVDNRVNIEPTLASGDVVSPSTDINPSSAVIEGSINESDPEQDDSKTKPVPGKKGSPLVIRPFGSSRQRPTFNPSKRKSSANGPAIITPTEIIPTIKATAVKTAESSSRRFSGPRRSSGVVASQSVSSSAPSFGGSSSSRRSFARPSSSRPIASSTPSIRPTRTSSTSRIVPTSSFGGPRRPGLKSSVAVTPRITPSSIVPSINRNRIRPSAALDKSTIQSTQTTPEPDNLDTTLITDDDNENEENESPEPVTTTTENSRRRNNPLLGRRPPFTGARSNQSPTTQRSVTITTRRSPLARTSRVTTTTTTTSTTPRTTRSRNLLRPSIPPVAVTPSRQRPASGNLFPPRGLFQKTTTQAPQNIDEDEEENDSSEDYDTEETNIKEEKVVAPKKRSKRQTDYGTRSPGYNPRFKRPTTSRNSRADYYTYDSEELIITEAPKTRASSRYNPRLRNDQSSSDNSRIKPTTNSSQKNRLQFTLREKDTNTPATPRTSNFRRPAVPSYNNNGRKTTTTTRATSSRFRYGQDGFASSRSGANSNNRRTTNRGRGTTRHTGRRVAEVDPVYLPKNDGTITVTHHIPTEVTIPIVVGKNTEYKNVITARASTEILGPKQYSTTVGNNGVSTLVILEEKTAVNQNGLTEITQYYLSETPTTSIIFTPTTIRGRKTSFSHVIPSTVYDAYPVISTIQPQGLGNAPLANILLSQLLLGNIGFQQQPAYNPLLGIPQPQILQQQPQIAATPVTEFKTRTTTYVTTIHEGKSTVLPVTFRGSKIYTTIYDESSMVITATEFITDTVVITPTQVLQQQHQPQLNSLLLPLLLQQQQQQQQPQVNPLQNINTLPNSFDIINREALESLSLGDDKQIQSVTKDEIQQNSKEEDYEDEKVEVKPQKKPKYKAPTPSPQSEQKLDTSVITLYVSGRRPGEFSTVLSTVVSESPVYKRSAPYVDVKPSELPNLDVLEAEASDNYFEYVLAGTSNDISPDPRDNNHETESLEFVLGDYNKYSSSVLL